MNLWLNISGYKTHKKIFFRSRLSFELYNTRRQTEKIFRPIQYSVKVFRIHLSGHKGTLSQRSFAQRSFRYTRFKICKIIRKNFHGCTVHQ